MKNKRKISPDCKQYVIVAYGHLAPEELSHIAGPTLSINKDPQKL